MNRRVRAPVESHRIYLKSRHGSFENRLRSCLYARKQVAKKNGLVFEVAVEDFPAITHCPLLTNTRLAFDNTLGNANDSLSVDRLDPRLGYTKDNTWVISNRANRIKNNATLEEFEEIAKNWRAEVERRKSYAKRE